MQRTPSKVTRPIFWNCSACRLRLLGLDVNQSIGLRPRSLCVKLLGLLASIARPAASLLQRQRYLWAWPRQTSYRQTDKQTDEFRPFTISRSNWWALCIVAWRNISSKIQRITYDVRVRLEALYPLTTCAPWYRVHDVYTELITDVWLL